MLFIFSSCNLPIMKQGSEVSDRLFLARILDSAFLWGYVGGEFSVTRLATFTSA